MPAISRILLVQLSFLGDVVLSTPLISTLARLYPEHELWMLCTPQAAPLVARDPLLKGVISFDKRAAHAGLGGLWRLAKQLRAYNFSIVYSLHRSARTALLLRLAQIPRRIGFNRAKLGFLYTERRSRPTAVHDVERNLALLAPELLNHLDRGIAPSVELRLFWAPLQEYSNRVRSTIEGSPYSVLVPGSVWASKRWDWYRYRELAQLLLKSRRVVLLGMPNEAALAQRICAGLPGVENLVGQTSLQESVALIAHAQSVVCNDSLALHVASASKRPVVAIFCATSPRFGFGPWRTAAEVVEAQELACKPCSRHGQQICPRANWACTLQVPAQAVYAALERVEAQLAVTQSGSAR
jgi:heptosyltransferase-2